MIPREAIHHAMPAELRWPLLYKRAAWRNTTPVDAALGDGELGIGFNLDDGSSVRIRLDVRAANHLAQSIVEYLQAHARTNKSALVAGDTALIRLGVSMPHEGIVDVVSVDTDTTLRLPVGDVGMLIAALQNLDRTGSRPESVCLDPSS